ncbi:MAG: hypothetical protein LBC18_15380 [Opitutaceae bacterium]|jgi:hypothetical protein|nr:hypothetical protein [Opitutaceae bacterium]
MPTTNTPDNQPDGATLGRHRIIIDGDTDGEEAVPLFAAEMARLLFQSMRDKKILAAKTATQLGPVFMELRMYFTAGHGAKEDMKNDSQ